MAKIIGTDVSLQVCKSEGYLMVKKNGPFNPSKQYRIFGYFPSYTHLKGQIAIDTNISWDELTEIYEANKQGIDSFSDDMPQLMSIKEPTYYSLVSAASTINSYCGLN